MKKLILSNERIIINTNTNNDLQSAMIIDKEVRAEMNIERDAIHSLLNYHLPKCMNKNALHNEYFVDFKAKQEEFGDDYKPYHRTTFCWLWQSRQWGRNGEK